MSKLRLLNIKKEFDNKYVLNDINLDIEEGKLISLLGPSGCGKSTILKLITGLIKPNSGEILIDNLSVINTETEKRGVVIVFQDYLLFPHMNVYENIEFGLKMKKEKLNIRKEKVNKFIELVKLNGYENKYPSELSGGQKQRVAIARALAIDPKILLLDEPFSNLDINLRDEMREFILSIQSKLNITTILVTHDKEEALMMSNKVAIMLDGSIKQFDTPKKLYERPNSIEVANFFGYRNYIKGNIKNNVFESEIGNILVNDICEKENVNLMISPENIKIFDCDLSKIEATIIKKRYVGDKTYYDVVVNEKVLKVNSQDNEYEVNDKIKIYIDFKNSICF